MRNRFSTLVLLSGVLVALHRLPAHEPHIAPTPAGPRAGHVVTNSVGAKEVFVPPGVLPTSDDEYSSRPARVTISKGFYVGVFEVTQAEFEAVLKRNPSAFSDAGASPRRVADLTEAQRRRLPVESVTWFDCLEFLDALSKKEGLAPYHTLAGVERSENQSIQKAAVTIAGGHGYRLPTEAEWEYCCRAGAATRYHFGNACDGREANVNGEYPDGVATEGPFLRRAAPVGSYPANKFGLHDTHGNVWEWCWDGYAAYPGNETIDYRGPDAAESRVRRGGAWNSHAKDARSAGRLDDAPDYWSATLGFRLARTP